MPTLSNVGRNADQAGDLAVLIAQRRISALERSPGYFDNILALLTGKSAAMVLHNLGGAAEEGKDRLPDEAGRAQPKSTQAFAFDERQHPLAIRRPQNDRSVGNDRAQPFLALSQRLLDLFTFGDVATGADPLAHLSLPIEDRHPPHAEVAILAVVSP